MKNLISILATVVLSQSFLAAETLGESFASHSVEKPSSIIGGNTLDVSSQKFKTMTWNNQFKIRPGTLINRPEPLNFN